MVILNNNRVRQSIAYVNLINCSEDRNRDSVEIINMLREPNREERQADIVIIRTNQVPKQKGKRTKDRKCQHQRGKLLWKLTHHE